MSRAIGKRAVFVVVNTPVGSSPHIVTILKSNPFLHTMYMNSQGSTLSKRDIERLHYFPPCGAKFHMLPYQLSERFFEIEDEPSGPDWTDRLTAAYIREKEEKRKLK